MKKIVIFTIIMAACTYAAVAVENTINNNADTQETYVCKRCDGTGLEPNLTKTCPSCNGSKKQTKSHYCSECNGSGTVIDKYGDRVTCPSCKGQRMVIEESQCTTCGGTGSVRMTCTSCHGSKVVNR